MRTSALALGVGLPLLGCGDDTSGPSTDGTVGTAGTGSSTGSADTSGGGASSTGEATAGTGMGTGQVETTTGATTGDAGTGGPSDTGCAPITEDASAIGTTCQIDDECPPGYTCQDFEGVVLEQSCQIRCEADCECPTGLSCVEVTDKAHAWMQCVAG